MKKILTVLFCAGALSSFAQPSKQWPSNDQYGNQNDRYGNQNDRSGNQSRPVYTSNDDRRGNNDRRYDDKFSFAIRERDNQIERINRDYNSRINAVRGKWFMRPAEKNRQIRELEYQRSEQIRMIYARFDDKRNKYNDKYYDKNYNWRR